MYIVQYKDKTNKNGWQDDIDPHGNPCCFHSYNQASRSKKSRERNHLTYDFRIVERKTEIDDVLHSGSGASW